MSSFLFKILGLVFMIIDHVGFIFFPGNLVLRAIGRLAFPLFAYQMAVGFFHTRDKKKHILKLLIFAIICQIPYNTLNTMFNLDFSLNIIFTFAISLTIIYAIDNIGIFKVNKDNNKKTFSITKIAFLFMICSLILWLSYFINVDYDIYGILLTIAFYYSLSIKPLSILLFVTLVFFNFLFKRDIMSALAFSSLADILFILLFNGKRGYNLPWLFYAGYFLHFYVLFFIKYFFVR